MVIYEWKDVEYLGKVTAQAVDAYPVSVTAGCQSMCAGQTFVQLKTYVCTTDAVKGGYCNNSQLGRFIIDLPEGKPMNETSFWSARVAFSSSSGSPNSTSDEVSTSGFWDNPEGNPTPPDANSEYSSPFRRTTYIKARSALESPVAKRQDLNPSPSGILYYKDSIQYFVRKSGYYCVGKPFRDYSPAFDLRSFTAMVPVTVRTNNNANTARQAPTDVPFHSKYKGTVLFQNSFKGKLPAAEYPKVNVGISHQYPTLLRLHSRFSFTSQCS